AVAACRISHAAAASASGLYSKPRPENHADALAKRNGQGVGLILNGDNMNAVRDLDEVFAELSKSDFRRRFRLGGKDAEYLRAKGLPVVMEHAADFIAKRLAPAEPLNDGRQTPWKGHPVFVAQHATATCCRGCLQKWHAIPKGRELDAEEQRHVLSAIERWLAREATREGV
ncbi:MAG TPA: DUF4186 domain-containing protein, partial [Pyrinomonadaceae bacterium]|nr:DUF4186 domain-containing protein [Pyrinomonadaceae bacterium]